MAYVEYGYKEEEGHWLTSLYWQQQLRLAQLSRQINSPHSYARSAAVASRTSGSGAGAAAGATDQNGTQNGNNSQNGQNNQSSETLTVSDLAMQLVQQSASQTQQAQPGGNAPGFGPGSWLATLVNAANGVGSGASNGAGGAPMTPAKPAYNPQLKRDQMEEEKQKRINDSLKQFWTAIDLSGQGLIRTSPKLFNYTFLQKLYLNHNKLTSLPPSIRKLSQLKVLDLSDNLLTQLPAELGYVHTLKYLFVFDNRLTNLPFELGNLFQLELLGIEGNPINDHIREIMGQQGTKGVVIDLRERAPVTVENPPREWIEIDARGTRMATTTKTTTNNKTAASPSVTPKPSSEGDTAEPGSDNNEIKESSPTDFPPNATTNYNEVSVMSYNVLCDYLASPQLYAYTPSWALGWKYRQNLLNQEILSIGTDIVCLQEVDYNAYDDWLKLLKPRNYSGSYWQKSRARRAVDHEDQKKVDGCAILFRADKFELIERHTIDYSALALQKEDFKRTEDIYNRVMNKDNVALVTVLRRKRTDTTSEDDVAGQPSIMIVATTHLLSNPVFSDVKLVQIAILTEEIQKIADKYAATTGEGAKYPDVTDPKKIPLVLAADFNSTPDSGVYELLSQGKSFKHEDISGRKYGKFTEEGMSHNLLLKSAYADIDELPFTNYTPSFVKPIDYIWYATPAMQVTSVLGGIDKAYTDHFVGFPNPHHPSDHIPIAAKFTFKKQKDAASKPPPPNFNVKK